MRNFSVRARRVRRRAFLVAVAVLAVASLCLAAGPVSNQVVLKFPVQMEIGGYRGKALRINPDLPEWMPLRSAGEDLVAESGFYPAGRQLAVFESEGLLGEGRTVVGRNQLRLARLPSGQLVVLDCESSAVPVTQVAVGQDHVVALLSDGRVVAWGSNDKGQLGDGTTIPRAGPVLVQGITNAVGVAAGSRHSLALLADGRVMAWGESYVGQLGNGESGSDHLYRTLPVLVKGIGGAGELGDAVKVVAGGDTSLALLRDGTVVGWGSNLYQVLLRERGPYPSFAYPVRLSLVGAVQDIALGDTFAMALRNGYVITWGDNEVGQLGDNSPPRPGDRSLLPNPVKTPDGGSCLSGVVAIAADVHVGYALLSSGEVLAWGGFPNLDSKDDHFLPVFVADTEGAAPVSGIVRLMPGHGVRSDGYLVRFDFTRSAWVPGIGGQGRLSGVECLGKGSVVCALLSDGTVVTWGGYSQIFDWRRGGLLGNDTWERSDYPVRVASLGSPCGYLVGVRRVSAGEEHALALLSDGRVVSWGHNSYGQLGNGDRAESGMCRYLAVPVKSVGGEGQLRAVQVAAGGWYSLALLPDGTVAAWGANFRGALGDGTQTGRNVPVLVRDPSNPSEPLTGVEQVVAGGGYISVYDYSLALLSTGRVLSWGDNTYGQLGNGQSGSGLYSVLPVPVKGVGGNGELGEEVSVIQVAAGYDHCLALLSDGTVVAWGRNDKGQLGDGTNAGKPYPVRVRGTGTNPVLQGVVEVAAGYKFSLARLSTGRVVAWGYNYVGQLGTGDKTDRNLPAFVRGVNNSGLLGDGGVQVVGVDAGVDHAVAVLSDGRAVAWGSAGNRQLGTGATTSYPYPVPVKEPMHSVVSRASGCAAGNSFTLVLLGDGRVLSCGKEDRGQLGNVTVPSSSSEPRPPTVLVRKSWAGP